MSNAENVVASGGEGRPSPARPKPRRALISVYDKTGIVAFARALHEEFGIELISTGGTARVLQEAGLPVTPVETITGFPEMMDGRVKTLHPRIHAAILADRDNREHMRQLAEQGIEPIDIVAVNLYPFEETAARPDCTYAEAIEMIDIGGPCLLRAAAKNHEHVLVECNPPQHSDLLAYLRSPDELRFDDYRRNKALEAYLRTADYDEKVADWLNRGEGSAPRTRVLRLSRASDSLRYGENPHQTGEVRCAVGVDAPGGIVDCEVGRTCGGTQLSFNNFLDASAAFELCTELTRIGSAKFHFGSAKFHFASEKFRAGSAKFHFAPTEQPAKCNFAVPESAKEDLAVPEPAKQDLAGPDKQEAGQPSAAHRKALAPVSDELTYRRTPPHWQVAGASYFVTFSSAVGEFADAERDVIMEAVRFWDQKRLDLHAAVVMRDHVHLLFTPRRKKDGGGEHYNASTLMQSLKAHSARAINKLRGRSGQVWMRESYGRWMRDEHEFIEKWEYIANSPVKEGLAPRPDAYRWWFGRETLGAIEDDGASSGGRGGEVELRRTACGATACCFIKHTNACGVGITVPVEACAEGHAAACVEALRRAYLGDPNAAMGGILAVNFNVTAEFASAVMETYRRWGKPLKDAGATYAPGGFFVEVWIAPSFDEDAVRVIRGEVGGGPKRDWGKRVRLLAVGDMRIESDASKMDLKRIAGGVLMQTQDLVGLNEDQWKVVTKRAPDEREMDDLRLAWLICKHTKSNAITICKDGMLIGNGAGQMSRVMSCRIATWLAAENGHGDKLAGAAAASDAFFPFRDGLDILASAGVTAVIQPGGSKRDAEVIAACDERGVAMIFTGTRHFKH